MLGTVRATTCRTFSIIKKKFKRILTSNTQKCIELRDLLNDNFWMSHEEPLGERV